MMKTEPAAPRGRRKKIDEVALADANEASRKLGAKQRQQQSGGEPAEAPKAKRKKAAAADKGKAAAGTGTGRGRQRQSNGAEGTGEQQGAGASGKAAAGTEMRGGTKQVLITEVPMTGRGGRPAGEEDYPFSKLTPAHKDGDGRIVGPSFFIPMTDSAEGKLAAARKRHKALFWSRKVTEVPEGSRKAVEGLRIWRGTPELADLANRT